MCLQNNICICSFPFCAHKLLLSSPREQAFAFLPCPPPLQRRRSFWPMGYSRTWVLHTSSAANFSASWKSKNLKICLLEEKQPVCFLAVEMTLLFLIKRLFIFGEFTFVGSLNVTPAPLLPCPSLSCDLKATSVCFSLAAKQSGNNSKWSLEITVTLGFCSNSF